MLAVGFTLSFTAIGHFSDFTTQDLTAEVTWESSHAANTTISNAPDSKGLAKALSIGSVNISAILNGVSGSTTLTATPATLLSIVVTPANLTIPGQTSAQFTATGHFSDLSTDDLTNEVTWYLQRQRLPRFLML